MTKLFIISILISCFDFAQNIDSIKNPLHTQQNIIKFADHLFCQKDYLRSAEQYLRIAENLRSEEIDLKIALSFSTIGDCNKAKSFFLKINQNSEYYENAKLELLKILFLQEKYSELRESVKLDRQNKSAGTKLFYFTYLKDNEKLPDLKEFIKPFDAIMKDDVTILYETKTNPPNKSPLTSAILSALIPGAGKLYTGEISDGIFALITTGVFSFLAYDNFNADHNFRGWLFSSLAAGFYAGNVYGSYASAQMYNVRIKYEFNLQLDSFLKTVNYFTPEYDFCK
jgi:TM2 domain-containing membrane protein YozV